MSKHFVGALAALSLSVAALFAGSAANAQSIDISAALQEIAENPAPVRRGAADALRVI